MRSSRNACLLVCTSISAIAWASAAAAADQSSAADVPNNVKEVIVTAPRQDSTARLVQETAPNIVNVQSADTIAKYPDFNAAEALGRMPGVSLSIDTGEGRFVTIRGIDSNLDGATFGGVVLLNSFPNGTYFSGTGRAVEFDTVPVGAVDRIEVTKTGLPDHEAEGIGGSIELSPRSARSINKPFADVELSGGYENLRDSFAPINEQVVVGSRFGFGDHGLTIGEGPFSFVLTQFQHNDRRAVDDFEEAYGVDNGFTGPDKIYDSAEFRRYNYFRRRFGYSGEFDFEPNADHHYFVRANVDGYTENVHRQRLIYGNLEFDANGGNLYPGGNPTCDAGYAGPCSYTDPQNPKGYFAPAAQAQVTLRDQQETHRNTLYAAGGSDRFGSAMLDYQVAYTRATYHKPFDLNWTFNNPNTYGVAYDNTNSNFPKFTVVSGGNVLDPTQYALAGSKALQNSQEYDTDEEWSFQSNVTFPLHILSDGELKIGGKVRLRKKVVDPTNQAYDFTGPQTLADLEGGGPFTYYQGLYNIGFEPSGDQLKRLLAANAGLFVGHYGGNPENVSRDLGGYYRDNEDIYAGYAQYTTHVGALGVLAGVRLEGTDAVYRGYIQGGPKDGQLGANDSSYVNAFPTVQLRYEFAPKLIGRLTYSTGVARPGFSQITASTSVDVGGGSVSTGNPNLQPTYSNNIDASLEWYLPGSGILAVGLFDKEMDNYIVTRSVTASNYDGVSQLWHIDTYENAPASARGAELQYQQKFFWAPEGLRDFGIDSNITYVDSQVELVSGVKAMLPGTARWTGNAAVFYEAHGLNLRLAAEYVGKQLFTVGGDQTTNNYEDKRLQVDFTSSYRFSPMWQLFFNAKNLNNEPLRFFEGRYDRPLQREFYDQTYELGLRAHF
jgi:TonB-dependent receptor